MNKIEFARHRARANAGTAWDRYVLDLFDHLSKPTMLSADKAASHFARIPQKGGDVFVGADDVSSNGVTKGPPGVQADLNAAGNIGLRALLDPDWPGAWWYVLVDPTTFIPKSEKTKGSAAVLGEPLGTPAQIGKPKPKRGRGSSGTGGANTRPIYRWRNVSDAPLSMGPWEDTRIYWDDVAQQVIKVLRQPIKFEDDPF